LMMWSFYAALKRRSFTVVRGAGSKLEARSKSKVKIKVKGSGQECPLHMIALSGAYAGAEAPLFHGRASCWVKVRGKVKIKGQDQSQRSRSKSKAADRSVRST